MPVEGPRGAFVADLDPLLSFLSHAPLRLRQITDLPLLFGIVIEAAPAGVFARPSCCSVAPDELHSV